MTKDRSSQIRDLYRLFDGKNLSILDSYYAPSVSFQDPVGRIEGLEMLKVYYSHAYKHVQSIEFIFSDIFRDADKYSASWVMNVRVPGLNSGKEYSVTGNSVIHFNGSGLIVYHRDFLDLGEMVYEKIPFQGFVISKIKQRLKPKSKSK
ncbi:MAG: nuclear transport factor 2 family protein [Bdellovibrionaceae bacterium]|nr:nuclear transport factor 2 family protein [Pseudobdellovibrionaceae bacterium]